jgi:hypothetical protein
VESTPAGSATLADRLDGAVGLELGEHLEPRPVTAAVRLSNWRYAATTMPRK